MSAKRTVSPSTSDDRGKKILKVQEHIRIIDLNLKTPKSVFIRGRVEDKTDIKTFGSEQKPGHLFSFVLIDESAKIRITCFGKAVDQFFNMVKPNQVFIFFKIEITN